MKGTAAIHVAAACSIAVLALAGASSRTEAASTLPCVQPAQPAWIDYADKWVPFRSLFFGPGLAASLAHDAPAADARRSSTQLAFWTMSLKGSVGTPARPAMLTVDAVVPSAIGDAPANELRRSGVKDPPAPPVLM